MSTGLLILCPAFSELPSEYFLMLGALDLIPVQSCHLESAFLNSQQSLRAVTSPSSTPSRYSDWQYV